MAANISYTLTEEEKGLLEKINRLKRTDTVTGREVLVLGKIANALTNAINVVEDGAILDNEDKKFINAMILYFEVDTIKDLFTMKQEDMIPVIAELMERIGFENLERCVNQIISRYQGHILHNFFYRNRHTIRRRSHNRNRNSRRHLSPGRPSISSSERNRSYGNNGPGSPSSSERNRSYGNNGPGRGNNWGPGYGGTRRRRTKRSKRSKRSTRRR